MNINVKASVTSRIYGFFFPPENGLDWPKYGGKSFVILFSSVVYYIVCYAGFIAINIQFIIQMCSIQHVCSL